MKNIRRKESKGIKIRLFSFSVCKSLNFYSHLQTMPGISLAVISRLEVKPPSENLEVIFSSSAHLVLSTHTGYGSTEPKCQMPPNFLLSF